jgi:hypothetical protein
MVFSTALSSQVNHYVLIMYLNLNRLFQLIYPLDYMWHMKYFRCIVSYFTRPVPGLLQTNKLMTMFRNLYLHTVLFAP